MPEETQALTYQGDGTTQEVSIQDVPTPDSPRKYFSAKEINLVKRTVCQGSTDEELSLFLQQCKRTGLDPFSNQIHAVFRWDKREGREVMQIQTGIDGYRLIAERTGVYDGQDPAEWCGPDGQWTDVWLSPEPPVAARISVYRKDWQRGVTAVAHYDEYVATKKGGKPNYMWSKMPANQLAKCAESLAIRKAFPKDTSGVYTREEMQQANNPDAPERKQIRQAREQPDRFGKRLNAFRKRVADPSCDLKEILDKCFHHAREVHGWGKEKMLQLERIAKEEQHDRGIAPEEFYIPDTGQTDAFEQAADESADDAADEAEDLGQILDAFEADLRAAYAASADEHGAPGEAVSEAVRRFEEEHSGLSPEQRDRAVVRYQEVVQDLAQDDDDA